MQISTNSIGNYSLNFRPQQISSASSVSSLSQTANIDVTSETTDVSKSEKEFFSSMYPENRSDIINYHFYGSSGSLGGVALGQNIDRKM